MDINAELDAFLATTKTQDPANSAEGQKLQSGAQALSVPAPAPKVEDLMPAEAAPQVKAIPNAEVSALDGEPSVDINAALEAFLADSQNQLAAAPAGAVAPAQEATEEEPGYLDLISSGFKRGVANTAASFVDAGGVAADLAGNEEAATAAYEKARAIEAYGPKKYNTFEEIHNFDSFAGWLVESTAEQAPVVASLLTGGGIGALGAKLVGGALIKNPATMARIVRNSAIAGGATAGATLETGGAGGEFRQRTEDYNPERALAVGVANGLLEVYGPAKLFSAATGNFAQEVGKGIVREAGTEFLQEVNTAANAAWIDENYAFFSRETALRVAEATATGGAVGGLYTAAGRGVQKLTRTEPAAAPQVDFEDKNTWRTALGVLREKYLTRREPKADNVLEAPIKASEDVLELSPVFNGVRKTWEREGILEENAEAVREFEDAVTERYTVQGSDGKWSSDLLTATDIEEVLALQPQAVSPKIMKVDLREISAGGITADPFDLPLSANDPRVFFAPWVKPEIKQQLLDRYGELAKYVKAGQTNRLKGGAAKQDARNAVLELYKPLAAAGLRVIPSRGSSFIYKGDFKGEEVARPELGLRSMAIYLAPKDTFTSESLKGKVLTTRYELSGGAFRTVETSGYVPIALNVGKVKFEDVSTVASRALYGKESDFLFKQGLPEAEKLKLIDDFGLYVRFDTTSYEDFKARSKMMREKGIQIHPKHAYAVELLSYDISKLLIGRATPGVNKASPIVQQYTIDKPQVTGAGKLVNKVNKPTAEELKVLQIFEQLMPTIDKFLAKYNLPPITVEINTSDVVRDGSLYDPITHRVAINLRELREKFRVEGFKPFTIGSPDFPVASAVQTLLHELGHYVAAVHFHKLPAERKADIVYAYEKARLRYSLTQDTSGAHTSSAVPYVEFQAGYSLTFREFLAEQFRRFAQQQEIFNESGLFYTQVGKEVRELAKAIDQGLSETQRLNLRFPSWEFYSTMKYLEKASQAQLEYAQRMEQKAALFSPQFGLAETIPAVEESVVYRQTVELVNAWRQAIPSDVDIRIESGRSPDARPAEFTANDPLTGRAAIRLWVGSMQRRGATNPVAHEALHAIWHLLSSGERRILVRAGRAGKVMPAGFESKYFRDYKEQLKKLDFNEQESNVGARQYVDEEYAAWLVGKRFNGIDYGVEANSILDRIIDLLAKVSNLVRGYGWTSPEHIMRALYRGEIAGRVSRRFERPPSINKAQLNEGEQQRLHNIGGGVWAIETIKWNGDGRDFLLLLYNGPVKGSEQAKIARVNGGQKIGTIDLNRVGSLGYEVDMIDFVEKFKFKNSGVNYTDRLYEFLGQYLKQEMRPSGTLYDPGYKMWKRKNPASVRYHQQDPVDKIWYSPKTILKRKTFYENELARRAKDKGGRFSPGLAAKLEAEELASYNKYKALYDRVPKEAYIDPGYAKAFMVGATSDLEFEAYLGMLKKEGEVSDAKFEKALTGRTTGPTQDPFMQSMAESERQAKVKNARALGVDLDVAAPPQPEVSRMLGIFNRYGLNNPNLNPLLSGQQLAAENDRISWFTKVFISIKQMAWNNPHIQQLRDYVAAKDEMNAMRMKWIARADDSVEAWDRLNAAERDAVSDLLFWATEMEYLQPNDAPRWPTSAEVAAEAARLGLGQEGLQVYARIQKDFSDYLNEVEQVLTTNIQRQHTTMGPNGQLMLSPAGQTSLARLQADMAAMRMRPYFPMVRFGEFTVTIRDPAANDRVVWFSAHPTLRERDAAAREIIKQFPAHRMQVGKLQPDMLEFQGLPPALLQSIKENIPGLTQQQKDSIDQLSVQFAPERSFRKRWLKRTGTAGYSLDGMRVYSQYFQGAGSYLAKLAYKLDMDEAINSLKQTFPLMRDAAKRSDIARFMEADRKYSLEPSRDWHKLRSLFSIWQLGFSPAAAAINLTQTPVFTLPYFAAIYGARANLVLLTDIVKSTKRAITYTPTKVDPQFAATRQLLVQMGKLETGAAPELGAYAEGGNLLASFAGTRGQRAWRNLSRASMWMFQQAERLNREIVLGLGWELSNEPSHPHLQEIANQFQSEILKLANTTVDVEGQPVKLTYETATRLISIREAISRTQFEYSRDYRPPFLRSPLASSFLVFFGYVQSALYAFGKNPGTLQLFLTFAFLFGAMGLPGAEDLEEVINAVARRMFGKDFSIEDKARELVRELTQGTVFDEVGPDLLLHGISRFGFGFGLLREGYGTPQFDASANGSLGRIVPGLAETAQAVGRGDDWKSITGGLAREAAGAGFGQIFPMLQFLGGIASGDVLSADWKKWESVMPRAMKAMSKATRYAVEGEELSKSGGTIAEFDLRNPDDVATIIAQGFGFTPTQVSMKWDMIMKQGDNLKFYQNRKSALMLQFSEAIRRQDRESKEEVVKSIQSFNRELGTLGLQSMSITSKGLKQSIEQRTRARRMQEQGLPLQKSATPLYRKIEDLFPAVEKIE